MPEGNPLDRLTAGWRQPTYSRSREVLLFHTAAGAKTYADSARGAHRMLPTRAPDPGLGRRR